MDVSESSQEAWYYTANGQRIGPVSRGELQEMAANGKLNPRYDQCWTNGMAQWTPAGEIEGLFPKPKADARDGKPALAEKSPFQQQRQESKLSETDLERELRSAKWPGATRRVYLFATWVLPIIVGAAVAGLSWFLLDPENPEDVAVLPMLSGIAVLAVFIVIVFIWLQRFQNLGMSRWWILGNFVPILNLWLGYRAMCCPAGYEYHRKLDGIGVFLAIIYWGFILLSVVMMVLSIVAMLGLVGGGMLPEFDGFMERMMEELQQLEDGEAPPEE